MYKFAVGFIGSVQSTASGDTYLPRRIFVLKLKNVEIFCPILQKMSFKIEMILLKSKSSLLRPFLELKGTASGDTKFTAQVFCPEIEKC